ncbi:MAG: hypothetical protein DYG92_09705 [Leptolyngbya sp. PLA1]|nr:hypothetical protein [Leptolyngbya sp. PLA1]
MTEPSASRTHWENRFHFPTAAQLVAGVCKSLVPATDLSRRTLLEFESAAETVQWRGVWHWTLVYSSSATEPGLAYIIPEPSKPRLCIPFPESLLGEPQVKRLPRALRDGLATAPAVAGTCWPVWEIQSKAQVTEVLSLLELKPVSA